MVKSYFIKSLGVLACAGLVWSATQTRWFYSFVQAKENKGFEENSENDFFYNSYSPEEIFDKSEAGFQNLDLPKVEVVLPEHEWINGYIPVSKDPKVIYFWNREISSRTNKFQNFKYDRRKLGRIG